MQLPQSVQRHNFHEKSRYYVIHKNPNSLVDGKIAKQIKTKKLQSQKPTSYESSIRLRSYIPFISGTSLIR